jgi:hypothetical protein
VLNAGCCVEEERCRRRNMIDHKHGHTRQNLTIEPVIGSKPIPKQQAKTVSCQM